MQTELGILLGTAISVSILHTASGPDHYIPFIAIGKSKGWNLSKIIGWTVVCGVAHVLASVFIALAGAAVGFSLSKISFLNEVRGGLASWVLFIFGILYFLYGFYQIYNNKTHKHFDVYDDGEVYVFEHDHNRMTYPVNRRKVTPWILFIVFLLGPCESLFPLLTYPAVQQSSFNMIALISVFLIFTLLTMVVMVIMIYSGFKIFRAEWLEKYMMPLSGASISICGMGMVFLQW